MKADAAFGAPGEGLEIPLVRSDIPPLFLASFFRDHHTHSSRLGWRTGNMALWSEDDALEAELSQRPPRNSVGIRKRHNMAWYDLLSRAIGERSGRRRRWTGRLLQD